MLNGAELIAAERERQITEEKWTAEHDSQHSRGELAIAAACYAFGAVAGYTTTFVLDNWPWEWRWWKPTSEDRIRQLSKAGALIAAEIDRLQRAVREAAK